MDGTCWTNAEYKETYDFGSNTLTVYVKGEKRGEGTYSVNGSSVTTIFNGREETNTFIRTETTLTVKDGLKSTHNGVTTYKDAVLTQTTDCTGSEYLDD